MGDIDLEGRIELNTIVSYERFRTEQGIERLLVHVIQKPEADDVKNGYVGFILADVWIPSNLFHKFNQSVIGKVLVVDFELSGRYARVKDVEFV